VKCGGASGEITEKSPAREAIEARGNFGFKAEARDREKRVTIGEARINEARLAVEENGERTSDSAVDTQVAAEAIAGAARNETERSGGASEDGGDLIERAIATDGDATMFTVEIADTDMSRERGLMFRQRLPEDRGMLFDFKREDNVAMWMKNTYLPLDMVFISRAGIVVNVAQNTEPLSERIIPSGAPTYAVLEVNAGTAKAIGLKSGDRVQHSLFAK